MVIHSILFQRTFKLTCIWLKMFQLTFWKVRVGFLEPPHCSIWALTWPKNWDQLATLNNHVEGEVYSFFDDTFVTKSVASRSQASQLIWKLTTHINSSHIKEQHQCEKCKMILKKISIIYWGTWTGNIRKVRTLFVSNATKP